MAQLTKQDFIDQIEDFNKNIDFDRVLSAHCAKTFEIDLHNILPSTLLNAIKELPNTPPTEDNKPELRTFYNDYFKAMWVNYSYARFLRKHGKQVTQFGIQKIIDQDAVAVSNDDVVHIIKGFEHDGRFYLVKASKHLASINYTLDGVNLSANENDTPIKPKRNFRILGA
jgi:site-specific recombinase XerC